MRKTDYSAVYLEQVEKALDTEEVRDAVANRNEVRDALRKHLIEKSEESLREVADQIAECEDVGKALERAAKEVEDTPVPQTSLHVVSKLLLVLLVVLPIVTAVLLVIKLTNIALLLNVLRPVSTTTIIVFAAIGIGVLINARNNLLKSLKKREDQYREKLKTTGNVRRYEQAQEQAQTTLKKRLLDGPILESARKFIVSHVKLSFSIELKIFHWGGLSDVHEERYVVGTKARKQLEDLVGGMPEGGTIGVSGPRGSGKTTLLKWFCKEDLPDTPIEKRKVCVQVSAPIKYDPRDFILHIFSTLCYSVLELGGIKPREVFEAEEGVTSPTPTAASPRRRYLQHITLLLLIVGAGLLALGIVGFEAQGQQWLAVVQDHKVNLIRWGAYTLLLSLLLYVVGRSILRWLEPSPSQAPRSFHSLVAKRINHAGLLSAAKEAYRHIVNINFQQSFSTGWKGSLSLPYLGAERTTGESLSRKQRTLPDIIRDFGIYVDFLRTSLMLEKPVVIAIDEMDKIESSEQAHQFLNDIKAIFGIRGCLYLVSISESAMSSFERRGLPFRDAFDSSFHEVVRVKYLDFEESIDFLTRRVIGLPKPFHGLCHCLSGGLARDLRRTCHKLLSLPSGGPAGRRDIRHLSQRLIRGEIGSKVNAFQIALKNLSVEPMLSSFVSLLWKLKEDNLSTAGLQTIAGNLLQLSSGAAAAPSSTPKDEAKQRADIAGMAIELGVYVYFLTTVEETFSNSLDETKFDTLVGELASARQELALNPRIALSRFESLRTEDEKVG